MQWRYISSKNNPADEASRGLTVDNFLACRRWIEGPDFLRKPEMDWPKPFDPQPVSSEDPEVKRDVIANVLTTRCNDATTRLMNYFSEWTKLMTSVAWFLRLKTILRELGRKRKEVLVSLAVASSPVQPERVEEEMKRAREEVGRQSLSVSDLSRAESSIIHFCQKATFREEISVLKGGASGIKKTSSIYRIDPVLKDDLLRVGGQPYLRS